MKGVHACLFAFQFILYRCSTNAYFSSSPLRDFFALRSHRSAIEVQTGHLSCLSPSMKSYHKKHFQWLKGKPDLHQFPVNASSYLMDSRAVLHKVLDQQLQHQWRTCQKCRFLGSTPSTLIRSCGDGLRAHKEV